MKYNNFNKQKIVYVNNVNEMNKRLKDCKMFRYETTPEEFALTKGHREHACIDYYWLKVGFTKLTLAYTPYNAEKGIYERFTQFVFFLDGKQECEHKTGMEAYSLLQRMSKSAVIELPEYYDEEGNCKLSSIAGLIWVNPKHKNKRYSDCYGYDVNSSYSWAMLQDMPDTSVKPKLWTEIGENEVGFNQRIKGKSEQNYLYMETTKGMLCEYVFPKIESPFKRFVNHYYDLKAKATNKIERQKYKDILNFSVGYIRRKNPFIHSAILSYAKYRIESLIDKNTIYCNTDSIVSKERRFDIEQMLGNEVGQFKLEHTGEFVHTNSGYQWNRDIPSVRGKSKEWFKNMYPNGYDILKDELPFTESNYYEFDYENMKIKRLKK